MASTSLGEEGRSRIVGKTLLSPAAYTFALLLANCGSRGAPIFLFLRPFHIHQRWGRLGEVETTEVRVNLPSIESLINRRESPFPGRLGAPTLPTDRFSWYCSSVDGGAPKREWNPYEGIYPGEELKGLLSDNALTSHVEDGLIYIGLSDNLKNSLWHMPSEHLEQARLDFIKLVISCLPDPYIGPLWTLISMHCREVIGSTVLPFLRLENDAHLQLLTHWDDTDGWRSIYILAFHFLYLGFGLSPLKSALFENLPDGQLFFKVVDHILNPVSRRNSIQFPESAQMELANPFVRSLIGFTIARMREKETDGETLIRYDSLRMWWTTTVAQAPSSTMEKFAHYLNYPQTVDVTAIGRNFLPSIQSSLGVALGERGHLADSVALIEGSLERSTTDGAYGYQIARTVEYSILSAELINHYNLLENSKYARFKGLKTLGFHSLRLQRFDNFYLRVATADAFISLALYGDAEKLLATILDESDLPKYIEIVSVLRLNKIWRRTSSRDAKTFTFSNNLSRVVSYTVDQQPELQIEFLAELCATVSHLRGGGEKALATLNEVLAETLGLYEKNNILQDDWRLRRLMSIQARNGRSITTTDKTPSVLASPNARAQESDHIGEDTKAVNTMSSQINPSNPATQIAHDIVVNEAVAATDNSTSDRTAQLNIPFRPTHSTQTRNRFAATPSSVEGDLAVIETSSDEAQQGSAGSLPINTVSRKPELRNWLASGGRSSGTSSLDQREIPRRKERMDNFVQQITDFDSIMVQGSFPTSRNVSQSGQRGPSKSGSSQQRSSN